MWFRNLTLYVLPSFTIPADVLAAQLAKTPFSSCESYNDFSSGWGEAREGQFVYTVDGEHLIALNTEKKVLPGAVVKQEVARRANAFTKERGHKPNKRQRKEIKEDAIIDLLPKAFGIQKAIRVWVSPKRGLLAIDTASGKQADMIAVSFLRALEVPLNMRPLRFTRDPVAAMTDWIAMAPPDGFTADDDTTFSASGRSNASVKYSNVALPDDEARRQIEGGKQVTRLAMSWDDKVSFVLTGSGVLRRVSALDVLMASKKEDDAETFAADFLLMTGTYGDMIAELTEALDGIVPAPDLFDESPDADDDNGTAQPGALAVAENDGEYDPLYNEARRIVISEGKASISLVQRHLRIGYNRAARLIEEMETRGVVSAMKSNGTRTIIKGAQA